jgi:hypothetical protein
VDKEDSHQCKTITVYPQFTAGSQEVYSDHITEGNQEIFLLRIKKKPDVCEQDNKNVELEVRTTKHLTPPCTATAHQPRENRKTSEETTSHERCAEEVK